MLETQEVAKVYPQGRRVVTALRGVSVEVERGEFLSLMGPSGCGKSTLLHLLGALDTPTSGRVLFDGQDLQRKSDRERSLLRRSRLGFVFQFFHLLPTLTVLENVALPLTLAGQKANRAEHRARVLLEEVGLCHRTVHFPEELSGGEMQRVAIARALAPEPDVVLCDEPTGNLDSAAGREILTLLQSLPREGRRAVVMVTHDRQAASYGDRIIHLRDGRVEAEDIVREEHGVAV
jgi:putative ABC transport system ATP-binding protein